MSNQVFLSRRLGWIPQPLLIASLCIIVG